MTTRTIIIQRGGYCHWKPKTKRQLEVKSERIIGSVHPLFMVFSVVILSGVVYLYSINNTASKGFEMKWVVSEISQLKNENEQLKIKEAELKSLYHIEEATKNLNMVKLQNISYAEEKSPVALK